jgi:hypothetical protein
MVTARTNEMYLVLMDQLARENIAAAAAAHHELGRDYDDAVAEGLVERIGEEIDKRVDARLGQRGDPPARRATAGPLSPASRSTWPGVVLALGSMLIGGITAANVLNNDHSSSAAAVVLIWIVIGVINVAYARRR